MNITYGKNPNILPKIVPVYKYSFRILFYGQVILPGPIFRRHFVLTITYQDLILFCNINIIDTIKLFKAEQKL